MVLTSDELTDDMLVQIIGPQADTTTLGALRAYCSATTGLINDNGFLVLDGPQPLWPISPAGIPPGCFFSSGLYVCVTPGGKWMPIAEPMTYQGLTASSLFAIGPRPLIGFKPARGSGQLYINGGFVCIA